MMAEATMGHKFSDRLEELLHTLKPIVKLLPVGEGYKYVVYSDFHVADKKPQDRFKRNETVAVESLNYYRQNGYSVILLGDIEDFHRVDSADILKKYEQSLYQALRAFPPEKVHRVFGNHDIEWSLTDPIFPDREAFAVEAIKLGENIILTHGHQVEEFYEKDLHIVRVFATLARLKENILGPKNKYSFTRLPGEKDKIYADWAIKNKKILICGHTHNPICASRSIFGWVDIKIQTLDAEIREAKSAGDKSKVKELKKRRLWFDNRKKFTERRIEVGIKYTDLDPENSYYFNPGGGIYFEGITDIEIDGNIIRLVHWWNEHNQRWNKDHREQVWGDEDIDKILAG
jgi:predicted phosphodiesterase